MRPLILLALLALPACADDAFNAHLARAHADLCARSKQINQFADAMISAAEHIRDPRLQQAQIDAAHAMLAVVAGCPAAAPVTTEANDV